MADRNNALLFISFSCFLFDTGSPYIYPAWSKTRDPLSLNTSITDRVDHHCRLFWPLQKGVLGFTLKVLASYGVCEEKQALSQNWGMIPVQGHIPTTAGVVSLRFCLEIMVVRTNANLVVIK